MRFSSGKGCSLQIQCLQKTWNHSDCQFLFIPVSLGCIFKKFSFYISCQMYWSALFTAPTKYPHCPQGCPNLHVLSWQLLFSFFLINFVKGLSIYSSLQRIRFLKTFLYHTFISISLTTALYYLFPTTLFGFNLFFSNI